MLRETVRDSVFVSYLPAPALVGAQEKQKQMVVCLQKRSRTLHRNVSARCIRSFIWTWPESYTTHL
ncbi:hypothetical protein BDW74DRAFT_152958 [Aspergillus multicolor]|uniref:uncharacterized protein n=1 Tax=Aspergillus multicolor TaxID=41759 RepID=UPI003CCDD16A